ANGNLIVGYVSETSPSNNEITDAIVGAPNFNSASSHNVDISSTDTYFVNGVAARLKGGAAILWSTPGGAGVVDDDLVLGFVNADGTPTASPFVQINIDTTVDDAQQNGSVVSLGNGNIVVAWENFHFDPTASTRDIRIRVFDSVGNN